ncbi:uncharacterized protein [Palaemon carinicauda]|uniref:uncharacterized protein n=1 Tax=Palaemon carinicauda TaxID=392227 RepID=UPI0035B65CA3
MNTNLGNTRYHIPIFIMILHHGLTQGRNKVATVTGQRASDTRKEVLMLVLSKISQHMADAEHLINDKEDDLGGVSEGKKWTVLIQCRLVGKAIWVYNTLEEEVAWDYHKDKSLVLKAYDLVPEVYCLRFRNFNKHPSQSFVEFARLKEEQFDDWLKSWQVVTFSALCELLLLEEFKKVCSRELRVHLEEIKASRLSNAAHLADEYELTHRSGSGRFSYEMSNNPLVRTPRGGGRGDTSLSSHHIPKNNVNPNSFSDGYSQITELAVVDSLPIPGIDGILGNDMLDGKGRELFPLLSDNACPVAITTRSTARFANLLDGDNDDDLLLSSIELDVERPGSVESSGSDVVNPFIFDLAAFIKAQKDEFNFELGDVDDLTKPKFWIVEGLLYRFSHPSTDEANNVVRTEQIVVPVQFRKSMLDLAQTIFFSGHLGMFKNFHSLARYFWWPGMKMCVKQFIRECETCQVMGKQNQCIPKALLHPIAAIGDTFSELVIDVVGPLPKTKTGFVYLLTIMGRASRFPEAIPMRRITSTIAFEKLIDFFSRYGLPRVIQTDCGTNFTSKVFRGKCGELAIQQNSSVPYPPERQTISESLEFSCSTGKKGDGKFRMGVDYRKVNKALPFSLFTIRSHPNSSTGVAPFELVFWAQTISESLEFSCSTGKKEDGKFCMGVDYRKVNAHTKDDLFPLLRIDDCLDQIGSAQFITRLDLLKGGNLDRSQPVGVHRTDERKEPKDFAMGTFSTGV